MENGYLSSKGPNILNFPPFVYMYSVSNMTQSKIDLLFRDLSMIDEKVGVCFGPSLWAFPIVWLRTRFGFLVLDCGPLFKRKHNAI